MNDPYLDIIDAQWHHIERIYNLSLKVFRTRDEVISKLSNEVAELKTLEFDLEKKFEKILKSDHLKVKSKIQFLLVFKDEMKYEDIKKSINTSKRWLDSVLDTLSKNKIIKFDDEKDTYYLNV